MEHFITTLERDSITYKNAVRFGLVIPNPHKVKFYFEKMEDKKMSDTKAKAVEFFTNLAAGAPLSNCTWGKSEREIRDFYLLAAQVLDEKPQPQTKYIFKINTLIKPEGLRQIREEIQRQLNEGVLLISGGISYVGREIEINGYKVTVEAIEPGQEGLNY